MNSNIYFQLASMFYIILLTIVYFSKRRLNSFENKIYKTLIIINIVSLILDVSSIYTIEHMNSIPITNEIVSKLYLATVVAWIIFFTWYIFIISFAPKDNSEEKIQQLHKKSKRAVVMFYLIYLMLLFMLPLNYETTKAIYSYGAAANISYVFSGICVIVNVISTLYNLSNVKSKKYIPILAFIILGVSVIEIQIHYPNILLISSMDTFITFLMYFTIENPDMKLINELNIAKDQAEKANNAKSDFLSSMSHEIRTPLNAIVGFSQALKEEDIPESSKQEVDDIVMASQNLLEIVNGILDISKIEANKIEIVNVDYNFKKVFDDLTVLTKVRIGEKPIDFRVNYDESIPRTLHGDYTRIKQVILNLLTNAAKYTDEGYIEFKVMSVKKDNVCRLIISVEDSGIGIKPDNINKLFTKFERFDNEKNITIEGTGLGLAITKKLIELMNGKIVVQSVYGQGSKFTVAIDQEIAKDQVEVLDEEDTIDTNIDFSNKTILIVDDNKVNLKVATRLLKDYKVLTEEVTSGDECLTKIRSGKNYDLILLDDMMPRMSGVETLHHLKENSGFNIPTVALTANAITGMREKYLSEGFDDYLAKPINKVELNKIIRKYLSK